VSERRNVRGHNVGNGSEPSVRAVQNPRLEGVAGVLRRCRLQTSLSKVGGRLSTPAMRLGEGHRLTKPDRVPSRSPHRQEPNHLHSRDIPSKPGGSGPDRRRLPPELPPDTSLKHRSTPRRPRLLRLPQRHAKVAVARYDEVARCEPPATGSRGRRCPELSCGERTLLWLPTCRLWGAGLPE